jgi:hypothetical protein
MRRRILTSAAIVLALGALIAGALTVASLRHQVRILRADVAVMHAQEASATSQEVEITDVAGLHDQMDRLKAEIGRALEDGATYDGRLSRLETTSTGPSVTQEDVANLGAQIAAVQRGLKDTSDRVDYICLRFRDGPAGIGSFFC